MRAKGPAVCARQGYNGPIAIHEMMVNSPAIKLAIKNKSRVDAIQRMAIAEGMTTLRMDGSQKGFLGVTDLVQINRVSL